MKQFLVLFSILFVFVTACSPDQVEVAYSTYEEANADQFFENGWIPENAILPTMVNIFCLSDVEANSCIFGFQASVEDIEMFRSKLRFTDEFVQLPETIQQPKWWIDILTNSKNYVLQSGDDIVFIAIQNEGNTVLGWRN